MTYEYIKNHPDVRTYIEQADASLRALGYTEHSYAHVTRVAVCASEILETLDTPHGRSSLPRSRAFCMTSEI